MSIPHENELSVNKSIEELFPKMENHTNDTKYMVDKAMINPWHESVDWLAKWKH